MLVLYVDLSLSQATEKSSLPAIIVTPSSPSSSRDFSIAFLADPPKPSLLERVATWKHYGGPLPLRIRSILIILFILFGLIFHLAADRFAAQRPYLELGTKTGDDGRIPMGWIDFRSLLDDNAALTHPEIIFNESSGLR